MRLMHSLPLLDRFVDDRDPQYFGRYRLWFQQATPWFQDLRALIPVRVGEAARLTNELAALQREMARGFLPLQCLDGVRDRIGGGLEEQMRNTPSGALLSVELLADVCYLDMRNFRRALDRLSPYLEDARFFAFSTGDAPDPWLDEHVVAGGCTESRRWVVNAARPVEPLLTYEEMLRSNDDLALRGFLACAYRERAALRSTSAPLRASYLARAQELTECPR